MIQSYFWKTYNQNFHWFEDTMTDQINAFGFVFDSIFFPIFDVS